VDLVTDTILFGGTILTMDGGQPAATAIALRDGRVVAVGGDEVLALRSERTELIDLEGRTACPGFVDAHHHITLAAWYERGIDLKGCRSRRDALTRISAHVEMSDGQPGNKDKPWLYVYNYRPRTFSDGGKISRYDLDRVAGDQPVLVMHFTFHEGVVSSAGLRACGITRHTADPQGGRIVRDRRGEPTGELVETAIGPVEAQARTSAAGTGYEEWLVGLERYCQGLLASGITHVCDPGVDSMLESYVRRARRETRLPLPVSMLFVSGSGLFDPPVDRLAGPATGELVNGVHVGALKLFADGGSRCAVCVGLRESLAGVLALGGRAIRLRKPALLLQSGAPDTPHVDRSGNVRMGYLHYESERLADLCRQAHNRGFQLAVHAACNAGIGQVLSAYDRLPQGAHRHRVEHLVSLDREQARRLGDAGAIGVVQPTYITEIGDEWEAMATPRRLESIPLRTLLRAGVVLAGSSDAPIVDYSPIRGMAAAITRRTQGGLVHQGEQSITRLEALRLWTTGAALAADLPGEIGVLRRGARADVVILSRNPLTTPTDQFASILVERTILGGRTVYVSAPRSANAGAVIPEEMTHAHN
jgi:predicted amidohydrolase YtcJ